MAIISLNPDFDRLNNYFFFWSRKDFNTRIKHSKTSKNNHPEREKQSYESMRYFNIKILTLKAQEVILDIDLNAYFKLLKKNNLQAYSDDILFVLCEFNKKISNIRNIRKLLGSKNPLLKYYRILRFLKILSQHFKEGMELIVMVKNNKLNESIHLDDFFISAHVLKTIENLIYNKDIHYDEYDKLGSEEPIPTFNDLSLEYIESKLESLKPRKGRRRSINYYIATFLKELLNYLNNETPLTSKSGTKISNRQAIFLFDLMSLIGVFNYYEELKVFYTEDYIRAILSNEERRLKSSKSSK